METNMESWLLAVQANIEAVKVEVQGMVAANQERISRGEAIAYNEEAFQEKAKILYDLEGFLMENADHE